MKWKKRGLIFRPDPSREWMQRYAWVPTIAHRGGDRYRVYFGGRNADNLTQTGWFEFDMADPHRTLAVSEQPVIPLGPLGAFDDSLAIAASFVEHEGLQYLYYVGWMQTRRTRYHPMLGCALSRDGGETWRKQSNAPMIPREDGEPFGMASPFVLVDDGVWRIWYASYRRWELRDGEPWPTYELRYGESSNGLDWALKHITCIGTEAEEAVARPWVIKENGLYRMWYSYRRVNDQYRIGYAESSDAIQWTRLDDQVGIAPGDSGWDAEMIEYPCVFDHAGKRYLLYNGNAHGRDGVGMAVLETGA